MMPFLLKSASILMVILSIVEGYCISAIAQNSSDVNKRTDEAKARTAESQAKEAEFKAKAAEIEAARAAFNANLPRNPDVLPTPGTITFEKEKADDIEIRILTFQALSGVFPALIEDAKMRKVNLDNSKIIIQVGSTGEVRKQLDAYNEYRYQAETIVSACNKANTPTALTMPKDGNQSGGAPFGALLEAPIEVSKSIANLLAVFKTDTTIASSTITAVPEGALVASLAANLSNQYPSIRLYDPRLFSLGSGSSFIISDLDSIVACQQKNENSAISKSIDSFLAQFKPNSDPKAPLPASDPKAPLPTLQDISKGARITAILKSDNSYILYIDTVAGGTKRTTRNLFTGTKLRYSGGAIVYYELFDSSGQIRLSGVKSFYTGFQKISPGVSN
jgi:hypothetical protein